MKKRFVSAFLVAAMAVTALAGSDLRVQKSYRLFPEV